VSGADFARGGRGGHEAGEVVLLVLGVLVEDALAERGGLLGELGLDAVVPFGRFLLDRGSAQGRPVEGVEVAPLAAAAALDEDVRALVGPLDGAATNAGLVGVPADRRRAVV
jgi:hypothetical protein